MHQTGPPKKCSSFFKPTGTSVHLAFLVLCLSLISLDFAVLTISLTIIPRARMASESIAQKISRIKKSRIKKK